MSETTEKAFVGSEAYNRLHSAHRALCAAQVALTTAAEAMEGWPGDDAVGARFSDDLRMALDGQHQTLEGLAEIIWGRYGGTL